MQPRELEWADIEALYELHARMAVERVNNGGECTPQLVGACMADEPGQVASMMFFDPRLVNLLQRDSRSKQMLMEFIEWMLNQPEEFFHQAKELQPGARRPDAVVHVTEVWGIERKVQPGQPLSTDWREGGRYTSMEQRPDRTEAVLINVHTKDRTYMGICPITGQMPHRSAEYQPLNPTGQAWGALIRDGAKGRPQ